MLQFCQACGIKDTRLKQHIKNVIDQCRTCRRYMRQRHKPTVRMTLATHFNEYVQVDLFYIWHMTFILAVDEST